MYSINKIMLPIFKIYSLVNLSKTVYNVIISDDESYDLLLSLES